MKSTSTKKYISLLTLAWSLFALQAFGQNKITLRIDDAAPEIRYSEWIKGTPIKSYENDRMYVVEFWASWCVPCKIAMPHLSELAKKYKTSATFIGVNSGELTHGKPYETTLPLIRKFVADMGNDMDYEVLADNNDLHMAKAWMGAAGQMTIPTTFLIKAGRLIWIGHPDSLENVMIKSLAGTFDVAAFKKKFEGTVDRNAEALLKMNAVMAPIYRLVDEKKYTQAIALIDKSIQEDATFSLQLQTTRFSTLLHHVSEKAAMDFAKQWGAENSSGRFMMGKEISETPGLSKETYEFAANIFELKRNEPRALKPVMNHLLAICYSKAGKKLEAIAAEEEAIATAKAALAEGKWPGAITKLTVNDYEEALKGYKGK